MLQLIIDFQYDDTHLQLVPTLDLMVEGSGLHYDVILWPVTGVRRFPLVRFRTRRQRDMDNLFNELVLCYEDQTAAREMLNEKLNGKVG